MRSNRMNRPIDPRCGVFHTRILPEVAGIQPPIWTWNGPGNIGGRVTSIVIHPTNPSIMWLGAPSGGVWKTTNDGSSWRTTTDFIADLNIGTMAMDPTNPNTL